MFIWQQPLQMMVTALGGNVYRGYLGIGNSGKIATSSNGLSFNTVNAGITTNITDVAYGNGIWMATTDSGKVLRSVDALTWDAVDVHSSLAGIGSRAVIYAGDRFVVTFRTPSTSIHKFWYTKDNGASWSFYSSANVSTQYLGVRGIAYKAETNTVAVSGTGGANYVSFINVGTGAISNVINGMGDTYYSGQCIISTRNGWLIGGQGAKIAFATEANRSFTLQSGNVSNDFITGFLYDKSFDRYVAYGTNSNTSNTFIHLASNSNLGYNNPSTWANAPVTGLPTSATALSGAYFVEGQTRPTFLTAAGVYSWTGSAYTKVDPAILGIVRYAQ